MVIDLHAHYVPPELAELLRARTRAPRIERLPAANEVFHLPIGSLSFSSGYTDIDERTRFLNDVGIDMQLLSLPGLFGIDSLPVREAQPLVRLFNEQVAKVCQRFPERFLGLAALPLADIDAARAELEHCVGKLGLCGTILPVNNFLTLDQAGRLAPIFRIADALKLHIFVHPGRRPDELPRDSNEKVAVPFTDNFLPRQALAVQSQVASAMITLLFSNFLADYPNASVHVANLGGTLPMVIERMDHAARLRAPEQPLPSTRLRGGSVHVDCSSLGPLGLELAVAAFGADKVVIGTDCPIFRADWTLEAVRKARISDEDRRAILCENAKRLLRPLHAT